MGWHGVSPPNLLLGLLIGLCFIATLHAQFGRNDPCSPGGVNFNISFMEETNGTTQKVSDADNSYAVSVIEDSSGPKSNYSFGDYFSVDYNPVGRFWYIMIRKNIDRDSSTSNLDDDVNILQYTFRCTPPGSSTIFSVMKIQITDINDNKPEFTRLPYFTNISELTPVGQIFYRTIAAEDKDEARNRQIFFYLGNTPGAMFDGVGNFTIGQSDGFVGVGAVLDFESMYRATGNRADLCYYNLTVRAEDQGSPNLEAITSFQILIEDGDDLGPEFVYGSCIHSTEPYGPTCIRARYLSNLQPGSSQTLVFTPYPASTNNSNGNVEIIAQDRDTLNSPIICQIAQTVPGGLEQYFSVSAVQIGGTKQYRCVVTYNPVNNMYLNRNTFQSLDIILQAIENTPNRRLETATITVNLVQTNTGPPVISPSQSTGYIYENSPSGTLVSQDTAMTTALRLTFSDPDLSPSDPVPQYTVRASGAGGIFTVTPTGYVQLLMNVLDYEQTTQYTLTVTITDPANPADTGTATVTVNVLDVNDIYPRFNANYDVTIEEGDYTQAPQILLTVTTTDRDFGPVSYSKISTTPAGSDSTFSVAPTTGVVSLQGSVNANEVYFINIRANDSGTPQMSAETVVVVRVISRVNQAPTSSDSCFLICGTKYVPVNTQGACPGANVDGNAYSPQFTYNEYTFQILEGPREDPFVGAVSASDNDAPGTGNSAVTYSIFSQFNSTDFTIEQTTGRISSLKSFDYKKQNRYQIVVRATDSGARPRYSDVLVIVNIVAAQDTLQH